MPSIQEPLPGPRTLAGVAPGSRGSERATGAVRTHQPSVAAAMAGPCCRAAYRCRRAEWSTIGRAPRQLQRFRTTRSSPTMARRSFWPARMARGSIWAWELRPHPESRRCRSQGATRSGSWHPRRTHFLSESRPTAPNCSRLSVRSRMMSSRARCGGCRPSTAHPVESGTCWRRMPLGPKTAQCSPIAFVAICFFHPATKPKHGSWFR